MEFQAMNTDSCDIAVFENAKPHNPSFQTKSGISKKVIPCGWIQSSNSAQVIAFGTIRNTK
jgi:hypothetical protein